MITEKQKKLLDIMISDLSLEQKYFYKPSNVVWDGLCIDFEDRFRTEGIGEVQSQSYNTLFSLIKGMKSGKLDWKNSLWLYFNLLKLKDKNNILEKTTALPTSNKALQFSASEISGRPTAYSNKLLTWDYLISLDTIITIGEYFPNIFDEQITVCELGAGWGRVAYYLTQLNKKISYNIFDIPHILLISHEYLIENVKHTEIFPYEKNRNIKYFNKPILMENAGIRFHISSDLEKIDNKSFDLFINIASFQEMTFNQVDCYFEKIDRLSDYFYNQQRYSDFQMEYRNYPIYNNWIKYFDRDVSFNPLWFEQLFKINEIKSDQF